MKWRAREREWDLSRRGLIMGILNVTPDSFSDGGRFLDVAAALDHARSMVREGADILDIGGESTRPGATPVGEEEERKRVLPVVEALVAEFPEVALSVDTTKSGVATAALQAGAHIVNDISGLTGDPAMGRVAAEHGAGVVLMHMQGKPRTMQMAPRYEDVIAEVRDFLGRQAEVAVAAGLSREQLVFDPGIGFGKALEHNLEILRCLEAFQLLGGQRLLLGVSRKSFIGKLLGSAEMEARKWPTVALTAHGMECGVRIFRVHDVRPNVHAVRMTEAILVAK